MSVTAVLMGQEVVGVVPVPQSSASNNCLMVKVAAVAAVAFALVTGAVAYYLYRQLENARSDLHQKTTDLTQVKGKLDAAKENLAEVVKERDAARVALEVAQKDLKTSQEELATTQEMLAQEEEDYAVLNTEFQENEGELERVGQELAAAQGKIAELVKQKESLKQQLEILLEGIASLEEGMASSLLLDAKVPNLPKELESLERSLRAAIKGSSIDVQSLLSRISSKIDFARTRYYHGALELKRFFNELDRSGREVQECVALQKEALELQELEAKMHTAEIGVLQTLNELLQSKKRLQELRMDRTSKEHDALARVHVYMEKVGELARLQETLKAVKIGHKKVCERIREKKTRLQQLARNQVANSRLCKGYKKQARKDEDLTPTVVIQVAKGRIEAQLARDETSGPKVVGPKRTLFGERTNQVV